jgi:two-component system response regulator VicR
MGIKKKILIAEDVKKISNMLVRTFKRIGYETIQSFDGIDALAKAKNSHPNIIILDILMPKKDGIEVIHELKADPELQDIPVIILSCRDQLYQIREGLEAGAAEYFTKPVFTDEIIKKVIELS